MSPPDNVMKKFKRTKLGQTLVGARAFIRVPIAALLGVIEYRRARKISPAIWDTLLKAHCASNGCATPLLNFAIRQIRPPRPPAAASGLLGNFSIAQQRVAVEALNRDGFYIFPEKAPESFLNAVQAFAVNAPAVTERNHKRELPLEKYDPVNPVSRTYKIPENALLKMPAIQKLIADQAFLAIAEMYLDTLPAIGGMDVWWSARYGNAAGSDAAQLFHFDFDAPPAWLKLFVYITDVEADSGPHVYVRGSHKAGLPAARTLRARGYERIDDEEIEQIFGRDNIVQIEGKRGTVFMADTRGFHKGRFPTANHRLLAQVLYCSPVFNLHGTPAELPSDMHPQLADALKTSPGIYERFVPSNAQAAD